MIAAEAAAASGDSVDETVSLYAGASASIKLVNGLLFGRGAGFDSRIRGLFSFSPAAVLDGATWFPLSLPTGARIMRVWLHLARTYSFSACFVQVNRVV
jgi:hypothetical protein